MQVFVVADMVFVGTLYLVIGCGITQKLELKRNISHMEQSTNLYFTSIDNENDNDNNKDGSWNSTY